MRLPALLWEPVRPLWPDYAAAVRIGLTTLSFICASVSALHGQSASSPHYTVVGHTVTSGGGHSASANYAADASFTAFVGLGSATPSGVGVLPGWVGRLNLPPSPQPDTVNRQTEGENWFPLDQLLQNDLDPDGDPVAVVALSPLSAKGRSLRLEGAWVIYPPAMGETESDSFTYTLRDTSGLTAIGSVTILPPPDRLRMRPEIERVAGGSALEILFDGVPGATFWLEASTNLSNPHWERVAAVLVDTEGLGRFVETRTSEFPMRFYRISLGEHPPRLRLERVSGASALRIIVTGTPGRAYGLEAASSVPTGTWTPLGSGVARADGTWTYGVPDPGQQAVRFYRASSPP